MARDYSKWSENNANWLYLKSVLNISLFFGFYTESQTLNVKCCGFCDHQNSVSSKTRLNVVLENKLPLKMLHLHSKLFSQQSEGQCEAQMHRTTRISIPSKLYNYKMFYVILSPITYSIWLEFTSASLISFKAVTIHSFSGPSLSLALSSLMNISFLQVCFS